VTPEKVRAPISFPLSLLFLVPARGFVIDKPPIKLGFSALDLTGRVGLLSRSKIPTFPGSFAANPRKSLGEAQKFAARDFPR